MSAGKTNHGTAGAQRLGTYAAWVSAVCCLPYLVLKVAWTLDVPWGITDRSMLHSSDWIAGNAVMAVMQLVALLLVVALTRPWSHRLPAWLLILPAWVGTGLLFRVAVGAGLGAVFSRSSYTSSADTGGIEPWVFMLVYTSFAVQGLALAVAFGCHVRDRWGSLLRVRNADVVLRRQDTARSWPERHLPVLAEVVAVSAVAVAVVFAYWAAGGDLALSGDQADLSAAMQAARAVGAATAAVGLFALAGRWGRASPFWLPLGLTWLGSGALVAFDGLNVVLNRLFVLLGALEPEFGWELADTVVLVEVLVGLSAAAVGVVATMAAARGAGAPAVPAGDRTVPLAM